uniref:Uncharacterized protein n=1 Tax=Aegilops tauschii subsp. strangulata TaxID=200361 RepID=A0A453MND3_AEGTS
MAAAAGCNVGPMVLVRAKYKAIGLVAREFFLSCFVTPSWVMSYDDHDAGRASERLWSVHRRPALFSFFGHRRVRSIRNMEGRE